jgi:hypothetical protein
MAVIEHNIGPPIMLVPDPVRFEIQQRRVIVINISHSPRVERGIVFIAMPSDSRSRPFANVGAIVQGALVVSIGIYSMLVLFTWLLTN